MQENQRHYIISGDIVQFRIRMPVTEPERIDGAYSGAKDEMREIVYFRENYLRMFEDSRFLTKRTLGEEFDVSDMKIRRGSIEIIMTVCVTGILVLETFSRYKNLCESIELLKKQLISMFQQARLSDYDRDSVPMVVTTMLPGMDFNKGGAFSADDKLYKQDELLRVVRKISYSIIALTFVVFLYVVWMVARFYFYP